MASCLCACFRRRGRTPAGVSEPAVRHHKLPNCDLLDEEVVAKGAGSPPEPPPSPSSPDRGSQIKQPLIPSSAAADGGGGGSVAVRGSSRSPADSTVVVSPFYTGRPGVRRNPSKNSLVPPGSARQTAIAQALRAQGVTGTPDQLECVICMEPFDAENPMMPTLCQCGVNRTSFHYACLLSWKERSDNCPACNGPLFFEEVLPGAFGGDEPGS